MRNPVGTHVLVGKGLAAGALADAERLGCEALQVFVGNPSGGSLQLTINGFNEVARATYAKIGFTQVGTFATILLD